MNNDNHNLQNCGQDDQGVKLKENEKNDKYLDLAWELKKTIEHERDEYTNCNWWSWHSHQRIEKGTEGHSNYYIIEIGQNTEKSPGNLRRLAVTQTPAGNLM